MIKQVPILRPSTEILEKGGPLQISRMPRQSPKRNTTNETQDRMEPNHLVHKLQVAAYRAAENVSTKQGINRKVMSWLMMSVRGRGNLCGVFFPHLTYI